MNGNPRNRNVAPPKQINRIAAPIQVTPQNNNVNNQQPGVVGNQVNPATPTPQVVQVNQVSPQVQPVQGNAGLANNQMTQQVVQPTPQPVGNSAVAMAAQNQSIRGNNPQSKRRFIKEYDPSTMIFVVILLIILACLSAFIFYVILPRINENSKPRAEFNDAPTTASTIETQLPAFKTSSLNNGNDIVTTGSYTVDSSFSISTINTGSGIDVSINGTKVTTTKKILTTIGRVDDCIVLILADGLVRSNRVVIYDKNANLIKEIRNIENTQGMLPLDESSGYIFSGNNLIIVASRIKGSNIILSDEFGSTEGIDSCNSEYLADNRIDKNFMVMATYTLSYKGNNEFADLYKINDVSLQEYQESNKLCR